MLNSWLWAVVEWLLLALLWAVLAVPVWLGWNNAIAPLFDLPSATYMQAIWIVVLWQTFRWPDSAKLPGES